MSRQTDTHLARALATPEFTERFDARDAAQACRLGLTANISKSDNFIISSPDTVMNRPTMDLIREVFPRVEVRRKLESFETTLLNDKARKVLGYNPTHTWRETIQG